MACPSVYDAFAVATESLSNDIYVRASHNSVWLNLIPRDTYKSGTGLTQTVYTVERQEPADDEETWNAITLANGSNVGACNSSYTSATFGYNASTYSPEVFALKGPVLCKDDLIFDHNVAAFLDRYLNSLAIRARRSWENRYLKLYMDFSKKAVADASFTLEAAGGTFTLDISTSELMQDMLDAVAMDLIENGATNPDSQGWINFGQDGPVWPLLIGMEQSKRLALNNSDFRDDVRYATMGNIASQPVSLLQRIGATRVIRNFRHVINMFPPRFTYDGAAYNRVNTFTATAGTKGTYYTVSNPYKAAPYEAAIVLNPHVFTSEIIKPVNSVAGLTWEPTNYMGEWQWVTGGERIQDGATCADPLHKLGRHYAEFKHAPRPEHPEFGVTIIYKRCPQNSFPTSYCT